MITFQATETLQEFSAQLRRDIYDIESRTLTSREDPAFACTLRLGFKLVQTRRREATAHLDAHKNVMRKVAAAAG